MDVQVGDAGWRNEAFGEEQKGKMLVFFHDVQKKHNFRSEQEKRPVFIPVTHIKKIVPGDTRLVIDRPMREEDKDEFPVEWARFEQKKGAVAIGTPLDAWSDITDSQKAEFRFLNIFTIDQFAVLPDSAGAQIMGFNELRLKARAFLDALKDTGRAARLEAEKAEADAKFAKQDAEMQELKAQLAQLLANQSEPKEKRHRRTKVQIEADKQAQEEAQAL